MSWYTDNVARNGNPQANINLRFGVQDNPDQAAQAQALAQRFNLPPAAVSADLDLFKARGAAQDAQDAIATAPKTQAWVAASPQNAKVAHDDTGVLGAIEGFLGGAGRVVQNGILGVADTIDRVIDGSQGWQLPTVVRDTPAALAAGTVRMAQGLAGYARGTQEAGERFDITAPLQRRLFGGTAEGLFGNIFRNIADTAGRTADSIMPHSNDWLTNEVLGGISNVPNTVLALGTGVAGRALGLGVGGAAAVGAATGGITQGGLSYQQARDQGVAPGKAFLYATADAATETAGEYLGEAEFLKGGELGRSVLSRFIRSQIGEQVGEQATTVAQDFSAWAVLPENKDKTLGDFFSQLPGDMASTAIQTLVAGGISNVAMAGIERAANLPAFQARREAAQQQQAEAMHQQLQTIFAAAGESKLRERAPQTFRDFMETQTTDTALEHAYIDGETLNQTMQADPEAAADLVQRIPAIGEQLAQALETGGDVRIPTADLATVLPGHALEQGLVDNLRVDPLARSAAENRGEAQLALDKLQASFSGALGEVGADTEFHASRERVTQNFRDQLAEANRFNGDTNEQYANLLGNFFAVQGARLGITPEQMAERYPLRIRSKAADVDATGNRLGQAPILNIGLSTAELGDGSELNMSHVLDVVRKHGGDPVASTRQTSDSEPTAVIRLAAPLTPEQGDAISKELQQEAIVQRTGHGQGALFGPQAANWGDYNPAYFVMADGRRASEVDTEEQDTLAEVLRDEVAAQNAPAAMAPVTDPADAEYFFQTPVASAGVHNIKTELSREGINQDGGVRIIDDTYLVLPDAFYQTPWNLPRLQERARELSARIGHPVEIVTKDDPRWADAPEAVLTKPPVVDGAVPLQHYGAKGLTETDPSKWGVNADFLPPTERAALAAGAPPRTYFGIATGQPGGYINEFSPTTQGYTASVPADRLYDIASDPDGLRKQGGSWEKAVKEAGYAGYWTRSNELGLVAAVFEPVAVTPMPELQYAQGPRGYITFGSDVTAQPSTITLLNSSDLSTFLHESGHFFLEVMSHAAAQPGAPAEIVKDMNATLKWMGVPDHGIWQRMTLEQKREFHEQFARGFEAYLFEGKAPNAEMRGTFQRFRSWLIAVYRGAVEKLNVKLNAEVRGVFDRMIASADTIQAAEREADLAPYFAEKPTGMTDVEWAEYQALGLASTAEAIDELQARSLRGMAFARRAQARELKRLQKEMASNREAVEAEVSAEINARPVFRAIDFVKRGLLDGEAVEGAHHFDIDSFNALYEGFAKEDLAAVKAQLGRGMFRKEGGVNPAQVAELFGFGSADHLITSMLAAPNREAEIEASTDLRMLERYGDLTTPGALDAAASEAIHNEVRARFVATELRALDKSIGKPRLLAKAAKSYAEQMIARLKLRDVRPAQYEAAERKAAKAARDAKGDTALAAIAKRNQLVNLYATRAAREAREEIRKTVDYFRKFASKGTRGNIDPAYLDQIDAMLERFDFRTSSLDEAQTERRAEKRRTALSAWIEEQRTMGYEPIFSDDDLFSDESVRKHYRDLTVEEMRGLKDAVANIEHLGRLKRELLKNKDERDLAAAQAAGAAAVNDNAYKTVQQPLGARTWLDRAKSGVDDFFAWQRKFGSMVREMDGNHDRGTLWGLLSRPMNDAADDEATRTAKATKELHDLFAPIEKQDTRSRVFEPAIGRAISLETRLSIAMNLGNATKVERILSGEKWTPDQLQAVVAPLTAEHWNFVQSVWDYLGAYWGDIAAKQRRVTGVTPERVEATPVNVRTSDGQELTLPGGYFPIKYDPDRSSKAEADTAAEVQMQLTRGLYTSAQTRRGHTKARVESTGRAMRYDFGVAFEHVGSVIHDLSWHETLIDLNRLLRSGPIEEAVRDRYGPATIRYMRKALEDIAVGGVAAQNAVERGVNYLRTGATVAGLGWNLMTSLFQPLGLTNSMVRIGPKYVARGAAHVFRDAASLKNTSKWVRDQSDFMRLRGQTQMREIAEIRQQFAAKGPIASTIDRIPGAGVTMDAVNASFFVLIEKAQLVADIPTWVGGYEKAVDQGETHDRAVAFADQVVRDSQGGGQISDLAAVQRGGPFQKLWTNFYSWFNLAYNQLAESVNDTRRVGPNRLPLLAVDFLLIAVVPSLFTSLLRGALAGDDDDEFLKRIGEDQLSGWMGFIFGLRELGAMFGVGSSYSGPAGARFIDSTIKLGKQVQQGEADEAFWKAVNNTAGVALHYPAGQVQRTVTGVQALADGKTKNPLVVALGPPPKKQ